MIGKEKGYENKSTFIEALNLVKVYRSGKLEVQALRGLNINIQQGEFVAIEHRNVHEKRPGTNFSVSRNRCSHHCQNEDLEKAARKSCSSV